MIKKILNKFISKQNTEDSLEETKNKIDNTNAVTFILDNNNEPYIHVSITDLNYDKATHFAKMLFEMNSGAYVTSIIDILMELSKQDDSIKIFIAKVIAAWSLYGDLNKQGQLSEGEPVINPTDFMKGLRNE